MKAYCPKCGDTVSDEQCPHWDYESDPRQAALFRVSYTYNYPSPAGPYRGKENRQSPLAKGDTFRAAFGLATVTSCKRVTP